MRRQDTASAAAEPLLDLERLITGIRWRRRIWTSLALLGLLLGALVTVAFPPHPTAVTRVLVVHADDKNTDRETLMKTDVALCQTSEVARAALAQINVNERPADFLATFQCSALTADVLEITVPGKTDADAARRAQALANVVIANHLKRTQDAVDAQAKAFLDRRARLERTLAALNKTIATTTAPAQVEALYSVRAGLTSQILDLAQKAEEARVGAPTVAVGTQLVDPPRVVPTRLIRTGLINILVGLVLGLGIGLAVAAVLCVTGDRPVLRRDIAAELGASVIAQLPAPARGARRLGHRSPQIRERQRVAATLARVVRDPRSSISLLEIGCPGTAAALALDIAEQLAPERPVVVVADLSRGQLNRIERNPGNPARIVDITDLPLDRPAAVEEPAPLLLGVGSVGPGVSWTDLGRLGKATLLVVRAGHATTLELHTIARQLAHAEISALGVVLVHPDPRDRSDGTLWEGLHTVLRERYHSNGRPSTPAEHSPIPPRNGVPILEQSAALDEN